MVTAPPGAGKSTLLPLSILEGLGAEGKILMLEPRRLAARQIAERMADMLGEEVGRTVGYRVRFEKKVSSETRIEVLTEGILTRMLINDPTLEDVSVVIFDEFHERSINSDVALALTSHARDLIRPDLRIVIMSATIDTEQICRQLNLPLIKSEGKMFPVQINYADRDIDKFDVPSAVASMVHKAHNESEGSILAFLPGQGDIQKCAQILEEMLGETKVYALYGNLSPDLQRKAIAPTRKGERKVVLATPIAETSLTIEGIRIVVDSGFHRKLCFDARTGLSNLETVRISKDMATQRAGRAGRLTEGICYRLWTRVSEFRMEEQRQPEILEADLAPMMLDIAAFGESDIEELPWMTKPQRENIYSAKGLLQSLGALDDQGKITDLGKRLSAIPCHPRISRMMLHSSDRKQVSLACDIAALLEEKDPMNDLPDTDISLRVSALRKARASNPGNSGRWSRIARESDEYHRMAHIPVDNSDVAPKEAGALLAFAYPERVASAMDRNGTFRLASGDIVQAEQADSMRGHQWIAIASANIYNTGAGNKGRIFLAAPLDVEDIAELVTMRDNVTWDSKELKVLMQRESRIGRILVDSKPIQGTSKEAITEIVCEAMKKDGLSMMDWNEDVQQLQRRVAKVGEWHPELQLPDFSTEHLMQTASQWLPLYLETNGRMATTATELKKIDLCEVLTGLLYNHHSPSSPEENGQMLLERLAPTHIQVPTGSRIRIDYRTGADAPVLSVRLQECFGMQDTPRVDDGRQPLLMELLSPGFKPVQLTQDLRSFWNGTYFEVRKELKRRYPKHYWPENPMEAEAVRGVKKKS